VFFFSFLTKDHRSVISDPRHTHTHTHTHVSFWQSGHNRPVISIC